jgi:ATP-dependent Clp protease, protease subunit
MINTFTLSLCGEITWEMADTAINKIYQDCLTEKTYTRILVVVSSPGGDVDAGWALYSVLKHLNIEVITLANGRIYSAGAIPFLAGVRRYVFQETLFLFHPTTLSITKNEERAKYKISEELKGFTIDDSYFKNLLKITLTKAGKRDINRLSHATKSAFIDSTESLRIGLATHLIQSINEI